MCMVRMVGCVGIRYCLRLARSTYETLQIQGSGLRRIMSLGCGGQGGARCMLAHATEGVSGIRIVSSGLMHALLPSRPDTQIGRAHV